MELKEGQSFVIAGLIDDRVVEQMSKIPGLGSIPILGNLFKSRLERKSKTELIVIVTPEIVRPYNPDDKLPIPEFPKEWLQPFKATKKIAEPVKQSVTPTPVKKAEADGKNPFLFWKAAKKTAQSTPGNLPATDAAVQSPSFATSAPIAGADLTTPAKTAPVGPVSTSPVSTSPVTALLDATSSPDTASTSTASPSTVPNSPDSPSSAPAIPVAAQPSADSKITVIESPTVPQIKIAPAPPARRAAIVRAAPVASNLSAIPDQTIGAGGGN